MASPASLQYAIWKACAGGSARAPAVGSFIYYFPEGHLEHAFSVPDFSSLPRRPQSMFLCQVTAVSFNAHPGSDEVYAKFSLNPIETKFSFNPPPPAPDQGAGIKSDAHPGIKTDLFFNPPLPAPDQGTCIKSDAHPGIKTDFSFNPPHPAPDQGTCIKSDAKVLTLSDANNGGAFSVPRSIAVSVFPALTYDVPKPEQDLNVRDMHGVTWKFTHIYRGMPRRHLLTTGWSKFVNSKKLIAGDTVVFIRHPTGQLLVSIRRVCRTCNGPICSAEMKEVNIDDDEEVDFSRTSRCRVSGRSVLEAVRSAVDGREFEVQYYPKIGWSEFVVAKDLVDEALAVRWEPGTRINMTVMEKAMLQEGNVTCVATGSPWRMLQVHWDNPGIMKNVKGASPWEVELASSDPLYVSAKRVKLLHTEFGDSYFGGLNSTLRVLCHILSNVAKNLVSKSTNRVLDIDNFSSDMSRLDEGIIHRDGPIQFGSIPTCGETRKSSKKTFMLFGVEINPIPKENDDDDV